MDKSKIIEMFKKGIGYFSDKKIGYFSDQGVEIKYEDRVEVIGNGVKSVYYKSPDFLHRFDGPALIQTFAYISIDDENKLEERQEKYWYIDNKGIPFWVPRVEDGLIYGNCNKKLIFDVIVKYNREYGNFLNKTYSAMVENKNSLKKDFQDLLLSMVKFYKEVPFEQLNNEIIQHMGVIKVSNIENPKEITKIEKVIEENVYELVINKNILYNEEKKILSIS